MREGGGERGLGGLGEVHVSGFLEQSVQKAGGNAVVELRPMLGCDGAVGGERRDLPRIARGFECADDGGHGVGEAAGGHMK